MTGNYYNKPIRHYACVLYQGNYRQFHCWLIVIGRPKFSLSYKGYGYLIELGRPF